MKKSFVQTIVVECLFLSFVSFVIATVLAIFSKLLIYTIFLTTTLHSLFFILPIVGGITVFLLSTYAKDHSMQRILETVREHQSPSFKILYAPILMGTTLLAHLSGASVGREGVAVQVGYILSTHTETYRTQYIPSISKHILALCGMSAGFAALFGTPLTAFAFAISITHTKLTSKRLLLYPLYSSIFAYFTTYLYQTKHLHLTFKMPSLSFSLILGLCITTLGVLCLRTFFVHGLLFLKTTFSTYIPNAYLKIFIGSCILLLSFLLFPMERYSGLGTQLIYASFSKLPVFLYDAPFKLLCTIFCIAIGFQGGEVTPLFAIGSVLGASVATLLGVDSSLLSAAGLVFMFSSSTMTLIPSILLSFELFGLPATCLLSLFLIPLYFTSGKTSIYGTTIPFRSYFP